MGWRSTQGFQNNPGFEMLEMLDSGPFSVEAGGWRVKGRGKTGQRRATSPLEEGLGQRASQPLGMGTRPDTKVRRGRWPRARQGGPGVERRQRRRGLHFSH